MKAWKYHLRSYLFAGPSLLLTLALGVYPVVWAMRYMFFDYPGYGAERFVGLDNFSRLLKDHLFWDSVVNTFIYAGGKLVVTIPAALLLAVILNKKLFPARSLFRGLLFMPTIISSAVISVVFFIIFNSYNGILNQFLVRFHLISENIEWLGLNYAMLSAVIVAVWGAVGNYMLLFLAGLQSIPDDLYESASIDGATGPQQFSYITIPMLGPVIQMVMLLAITVSLKGYESIMVLTEGGPVGKTEVMFLYVYKLFFPTPGTMVIDQQIGYGSAAGFTTGLIVGLITIVYFAVSRRLNKIY